MEQSYRYWLGSCACTTGDFLELHVPIPCLILLGLLFDFYLVFTGHLFIVIIIL